MQSINSVNFWKKGIKHVLARVQHPQTNGKIERIFGPVEAKKRFFRDIDELIEWHNYDKPP